jgi:hypothetical protein
MEFLSHEDLECALRSANGAHAPPAEHAGVCWAAAIGRASRGGRSHTEDWGVIIEDELAGLAAHPESCTCRRKNRRNTRACGR